MEPLRATPPHRHACDLCKQMKIKCERYGSKCKHCIFRRVACVVTPKEKKPRPQKRDDYIRSIESRIEVVESAIKASGLIVDGNQISHSTDFMEDQAGSPAELFTLTGDAHGASCFVGSSSGFSIISMQGLNWISEITGSDDFAQTLSEILKNDQGISSHISDMFHPLLDHERQPMPSKGDADIYIAYYFEIFNPIFPVYDRTVFLDRYSRQYPVASSDDVVWYASLNIVILIGYILSQNPQGGNNGGTGTYGAAMDSYCWRWLRNATSTFADLQFKGVSLGGVQAMLGMALIMHALPDPHPSYILAGAAIRIAQSIGLNGCSDDYGLTPAEIEQRRLVFWVSFVLDKSTSLRSGRPPVLYEEHIEVELPKFCGDLRHYPDGSRSFNTFAYMVRMAFLNGRIYSRLYSAKSSTLTGIERLKLIGTLDEEIQAWRETIPIEIRPEHNIQCHETQFVPVVLMHLSYYNALTTIHRLSIQNRLWASMPDNEVQIRHLSKTLVNPRLHASGTICLNAARRTIKLFTNFSSLCCPGTNSIRMSNYYPLTASLTLFTNIIQNPLDPLAQSDLDLMTSVTAYISTSKVYGAEKGSIRFLRISDRVNSFAKATLDRAHSRTHECSERLYEESNTGSTESTPGGSSNNSLRRIQPRGYISPSASPAMNGLRPLENIDPIPAPAVDSFAYQWNHTDLGNTNAEYSSSSIPLQESSTYSLLDYYQI